MSLYTSQFNYDMAEPDPDLSHIDDQYIEDQVERLMTGEHADNIDWKDFALVAAENLCCVDDNDFALIQILLALRNNKPELAQLIYQRRFDSVVFESAEGMVRHRMEKAA